MNDLALPTNAISPGLAPALAQAARAVVRADGPAGGATERVAKDFESILLNRLLEEMNNTVGESGLLDDKMSKQIYGIFTYYLSQDLAQKGGLGLWKQLHMQMVESTGAAGLERPSTEQLR